MTALTFSDRFTMTVQPLSMLVSGQKTVAIQTYAGKPPCAARRRPGPGGGVSRSQEGHRRERANRNSASESASTPIGRTTKDAQTCTPVRQISSHIIPSA